MADTLSFLIDRRLVIKTVLPIVLLLLLTPPVAFTQSSEQVAQAGADSPAGPLAEAVGKVLYAYQHSLNHADAEASLVLYTDDAVVMMPNHPSLVGKPAIRAAYEAGSKSVTFAVIFKVLKVVQMSPDWAYARTSSTGHITTRSTGVSSDEANQELFILHREKGAWLIAIYSFSSTRIGPA